MNKEQAENFKIDELLYDSTSDVLYTSTGKPRAAICVEAQPGDLVRLDPYDHEVIGITIIGFQERYKPPNPDDIKEFAENICQQILGTMIYPSDLEGTE